MRHHQTAKKRQHAWYSYEGCKCSNQTLRQLWHKVYQYTAVQAVPGITTSDTRALCRCRCAPCCKHHIICAEHHACVQTTLVPAFANCMKLTCLQNAEPMVHMRWCAIAHAPCGSPVLFMRALHHFVSKQPKTIFIIHSTAGTPVVYMQQSCCGNADSEKPTLDCVLPRANMLV
jgi:hypothetical protein